MMEYNRLFEYIVSNKYQNRKNIKMTIEIDDEVFIFDGLKDVNTHKYRDQNNDVTFYIQADIK